MRCTLRLIRQPRIWRYATHAPVTRRKPAQCRVLAVCSAIACAATACQAPSHTSTGASRENAGERATFGVKAPVDVLRSFTSESGEYRLDVVRLGEIGTYQVHYELYRAGRLAWKLHHVRIDKAAITNDGVVVCFTETGILSDDGEAEHPGLRLVVLDRAGREVLSRTRRTWAPRIYSYPSRRSTVREVVIDEAADEVSALSIAEPRWDAGGIESLLGRQVWYVYRLSTGEELEMIDADPVPFIRHRYKVTGTQLTLSQYPNFEGDTVTGTLFNLLDANCNMAWHLIVRHESAIKWDLGGCGDGDAEVDGPPCFELRPLGGAAPRRFTVEPGNGGGWVVDEVLPDPVG